MRSAGAVSTNESLPANTGAERALLGAILIDNKVVDRVFKIVEPEEFGAENHRVCYRAMLRISGRSEAIDLVTLEAELSDRKELERAGGGGYIASLLDAVPDIDNAESYARLVKEAAIRRHFKLADDSPLMDELNSAERHLREQLEDLRAARQSVRPEKLEAIPILVDIPSAVGLNMPRNPVSFGIAPVDHFMGGGIDRDEALVIGGAPGAFKTSLVAYALPHLATAETAVLFVASDEPANRVARKIGTRYGEVWSELCSDYPVVIERIKAKLEQKDAFIRITHPQAAYTLEEALNEFDRVAPKGRQRIVIIDHLHSVTVEGADEFDNSKEEVERVVGVLIDDYKRARGWSLVALSEITKAALFAPIVNESPMAAFADTRKIVSRFDAALVLVPDGQHRVRGLVGKSRLGPRTPFTLEWNIETWSLTHVSDSEMREEEEGFRAMEQRKKVEEKELQQREKIAKCRRCILEVIATAENPTVGVKSDVIRGAWIGRTSEMKPMLAAMVHEGVIEEYLNRAASEGGRPPVFYRMRSQGAPAPTEAP